MSYITLDGHEDSIPILEYPGEVIFADEFEPTYEDEYRCSYDTIVFWDFAEDLMCTDYFEENFGRSEYFAAYVFRACSRCGEVKKDENGNTLMYLKLIRNTRENREKYQYNRPNNERYFE